MISFKFSKSNVILLLAAAIWGFAFVAQRAGMRHIGPFTFNGIRFALGALALFPFIMVKQFKQPEVLPFRTKHLVMGGLLAGILLFAGASFQQVGIVYTTAGNAGFITSLYVIMVPIFGLMWGHKTNFQTWIGVLLAATGLYFLSVTDQLALSPGNGIVFIAAVFFAFHVIIIGWYSNKTNPIEISIIQFAICAFLSIIIAIITEEFTWQGMKDAALPLLYGGIFSVGIAFTLQVIGQRKAKPAYAAIILSLESVFAAFSGWLLLNEGFTARGLMGCGMMFTGIIISQIKKSKL